MIVFIPGALRTAQDLASWKAELGEMDVRFLELPGHGDAPHPGGPSTLETFVEDVGRRLPDDAVLVGESLGGLVAMAFADRARAVVAIDPPLTTLKQAGLRHLLRQRLAEAPGNKHLHAFVWDAFGIALDRAEERDYRDRLARGAHVITGTVKALGGRYAPSLLDAADEALILQRGLLLHRVEGAGHLILHPEFSDRTAPLLRSIIEVAVAA